MQYINEYYYLIEVTKGLLIRRLQILSLLWMFEWKLKKKSYNIKIYVDICSNKIFNRIKIM